MVQPWVAALGVAGIAAFAIGTIVYVIIKANEKKLKYTSDSSTRCHEIYTYEPETKSVTECAAPVRNDSNNNLRKRQVSKSKPSDVGENKSEQSNDKKRNLTVSKEVQTDPVDRANPIDVNRNVNEKKVYLDKTFTPMSVEDKVNEYIRNIPAASPENEESDTDTISQSGSSNWSKLSSEKSTDNSEKAYKKRIHRSFQKYVNTMVEAHCESQSESAENSDSLSSCSSISTSSSWSNISSEKSSDDFEKKYKKKMYKSFKKFVKNMNSETSKASTDCASDESDDSSSILSKEYKECVTCEKSPANAYTQPCKHRYLCSDCAMKFYRLHKKCKICRSKIEKFVIED